MSDITENLDESKKILIVGIAGILFSLVLSLIMYLVGINTILNASIVLCLFVVLACTLTFAVSEKTRVVSKEKEEIESTRSEFLPYLEKIMSLVEQIDQELEACEVKIEELGKSFSDSAKEQIKAVNRIKDKLKERANVLEHVLKSDKIEKIDEVKKIINDPLTFPVDSVNYLVSESVLKIPDLPREQWEPTISKILENLNQEVRV